MELSGPPAPSWESLSLIKAGFKSQLLRISQRKI